MGTQAMQNMIMRGELAGVAALIVIGIALIALAPAKHASAAVSGRSSRYQAVER
jgi:hypothetical protein